MSGINGMSADNMLQLFQSLNGGKGGSKTSVNASASISTSTSSPSAIVSLGSGGKASQGNYVFQNLIPSSYQSNAPRASIPEYTGLTKGESKISKEELREAIIKMAQEDRARSSTKPSGQEGLNELIDQYICYASPDRAGIIAEGIKGMTYPTDVGPNCVAAMVTDPNTGAVAASYIVGQGWVTSGTKEEGEASKEFYQLYNDVFYGKYTGDSASSDASGASTNGASNSSTKVDYKA